MNNKGQAFPIVIALSAAALVTAIYIVTGMSNDKELAHLNYVSAAYVIANNITTYVNDPVSWIYTKNYFNSLPANTTPNNDRNTVCVTVTSSTSPGFCSSTSPTTTNLMQIQNTTGAVYYDSTSATAGFDLSGNPCSGFDGTNGNDACPFHPRVYWLTPNPQFAVPKIQIKIDIDYKPKSKYLIFPLNATSMRNQNGLVNSFVINRVP